MFTRKITGGGMRAKVLETVKKIRNLKETNFLFHQLLNKIITH